MRYATASAPNAPNVVAEIKGWSAGHRKQFMLRLLSVESVHALSREFGGATRPQDPAGRL